MRPENSVHFKRRLERLNSMLRTQWSTQSLTLPVKRLRTSAQFSAFTAHAQNFFYINPQNLPTYREQIVYCRIIAAVETDRMVAECRLMTQLLCLLGRCQPLNQSHHQCHPVVCIHHVYTAINTRCQCNVHDECDDCTDNSTVYALRTHAQNHDLLTYLLTYLAMDIAEPLLH